MVPGLHNLSVFGSDSFRRVDHILVRCSATFANWMMSPGPIPSSLRKNVSRCAAIATLPSAPGQRGSRYMPGADAQSIVRNALEDDYRNTDPGNFQLADNVTFAKIVNTSSGMKDLTTLAEEA